MTDPRQSLPLSGTILAIVVLACGASAWAIFNPALAPTPANPSAHVRVGAMQDDEDADNDELVITLDKAPEAVRAAAVKQAGGAKNITRVTRESDEGAMIFEVEYTDAGAACSADFTSDGEIMEVETPVEVGSLPAAVVKALAKRYPDSAIAEARTVTKTLFEVQLKTNGKTHEVAVLPTGDMHDEHGSKAEEDEHDEKGAKGDDDDEEDDDND